MKKIYIDCIGIDGKQHICEPHLNVTLCGVKVTNKKPTLKDKQRYSCYECSY